MNYKLGGIILSKKPHACGSNKWIIVRVGADIKLKCDKCARCVFLSVDEVKKITKSYIEAGEDNGK